MKICPSSTRRESPRCKASKLRAVSSGGQSSGEAPIYSKRIGGWTGNSHPARVSDCSRARVSVKTPDASRKRSEEHTSELQSPDHLVCRLLLEKKKKIEQHCIRGGCGTVEVVASTKRTKLVR